MANPQVNGQVHPLGGKVPNWQSKGFDIRREKFFLAATTEKTRAKVTQNMGERGLTGSRTALYFGS